MGGQKPSSNKSIAITSVNLLLCLKEDLVTTISLKYMWAYLESFSIKWTLYICSTLRIFPKSPHIYQIVVSERCRKDINSTVKWNVENLNLSESKRLTEGQSVVKGRTRGDIITIGLLISCSGPCTLSWWTWPQQSPKTDWAGPCVKSHVSTNMNWFRGLQL